MEKEIDIEKENFIRKKKEETENSAGAVKEQMGVFDILKNIFKQSSNKCIENEFLEDFYKKYPVLDIEDHENIDQIKQDFAAIMEYDDVCCQRRNCRCSTEILDFNKVKINKNHAYIARIKSIETDEEGSPVARFFLSLFMKTNLNERLHVSTKKSLFKQENFENCFCYDKEKISELDAELVEEFSEILSDDFYFSRFSLDNDAEFFELDSQTKQKLFEILKKYKIPFYIAIKNNLLRIQIEFPNNLFESRYGLLFYMEKTFDLLLELMLEFERINDSSRLRNIEKEYSNIKNIIFDLDNTIILDTEEDSEYYRELLINNGYTDDYFYGIYQAIAEYDKGVSEENPYYNEQELLEFINEYLEQDFSMSFLEGIKETVAKYWTKRILISKDVLEYLSSKYNLYIYTNYFQDAQEKRLKNIGYEQYFKKVFGSNKYGCKQFKKCFANVLNEINAKPEECVMIGDDKSIDIVGANNLNMKAILFDYNGRRDKKVFKNLKNYIVIKDMNDLKKIF